ncbi:centrosomal protein of 162 kDa isoform X1 [Bombyx mori]|uniref:Centrosomal protein of 162 kDa n=1 Tax=Bombyx mori TaxID=7091 RepID=A0A8R1WKA2_BOMMO|nr:centrosomal protein of 162 kDa isoform X1 [Bombyx mori]
MAKSLMAQNQDLPSNDNSLSTREFLHIEKTCEAFKDSDEEIKMILSEINKLSGGKTEEKLLEGDVDDVELILKRAEDIALETENLLKNSPVAAKIHKLTPEKSEPSAIPEILVTKPTENSQEIGKPSQNKVNQYAKHNVKENVESRRKSKSRPFSAGVIDSKKDSGKVARFSSNSPKKANVCKHENLLEELKDTNERAKSLELTNVQLTDDNKLLRKKLDKVNEEKHVADLKLIECEKFISRLGKEYENRNSQLKTLQENEGKIMAELNKKRNDRKNLTIQRDKDAIVIQDLQRQVKEMELILKRKHPDSVSALIVASKSSTVEDNKKKLLEERISRLEIELKDKEDHFQGILMTLQEKFGDMKQKYEKHIIDVERQLMDERRVNNETRNRLNKTNLIDVAVQTGPRNQHTIGTQTLLKPDRTSSAVSRVSQNSTLILNRLKEDSYLVATIKGLQVELTAKQRTIGKINRETEELRKNLRTLQKEKEVLLNLNPHKKVSGKQGKSTENILARINTEMEAELTEVRKENEVLVQEKSSLLDSLKRSNEDFIVLKKKRIQDLHTLQLAHEKELMQMNMQIYPLQEEIKLLNRTIEILQERVQSTEDKMIKYQTANNVVDLNGGGDNLSRNTRESR